MLKSLNIKNYAIIDNLNIEFEKGFNCFTGETGAGKSIIVGALSFLLKGRSDNSVIKSGKDKAIIEGVFSVDNEDIKNKLLEQDIDVDDEIIVKRTISRDNHNSIKINEANVTLNFLTDLFSNYVDIHSQKDSQYLYNKKNQLEMLDNFANNTSLKNDYVNAFNDYCKINSEYNDLLNGQFNENEIDFIKYNLKELEDADLSIEDENKLIEDEKKYKSLEKYNEIFKNIEYLYNDENGIREKLYNLKQAINIEDDDFNNYSNIIENIYYELDDNIEKIKEKLKESINDDLDIDFIEDRLFLYSKLKRKHKMDTLELMQYKQTLKDKLKMYDNKEEYLNDKKRTLEAALKKANELAIELSKSRKKTSKYLIESIEKEANDLILNNFIFDIDFKESELSINGKDDIEFLVSLNKGEQLKPLKNIASGGEMSRIMLALKVVLSKLSNIGLMIFDEIDTGVSGMVAHAVGKKIATISNDIQIICITHLAPVAACSDYHYLIYKDDITGTTTTNVSLLNENERIEQLAIISNTSKDPKALAAAKELYLASKKATHENK